MANPNNTNKLTDGIELLAGEAICFQLTAEQRALSELLLLRCGDTRLIGSQMTDQARLCGQAVKAAFEELSKEADSKE
jgi:hypothetical protein